MNKNVNEQIVDAVLMNDKEGFMSAFRAAMAVRVEDALEIKKVEVASTMLGAAEVDQEDTLEEEVEQVDEANMRFDPETAATPTSRDVKNFQNRSTNRRAATQTNKYIRRMTKLGGFGPGQTKKDTEEHMKSHFDEEVEQVDEIKLDTAVRALVARAKRTSDNIK